MVQIARPNSTVTANGWTDVGGAGSLHAATSDQSDSTYARGANGSTLVATLGLASVTDPAASTGHILSVRAKVGSGASAAEKLTWFLYEGATLRATSPATNISRTQITQYDYTLTAGEADAITDYSALRVALQQSTVGGTEWIGVYEAWLEVPDPPVDNRNAALGDLASTASLSAAGSKQGKGAAGDLASSASLTPPGATTQRSGAAGELAAGPATMAATGEKPGDNRNAALGDLAIGPASLSLIGAKGYGDAAGVLAASATLEAHGTAGAGVLAESAELALVGAKGVASPAGNLPSSASFGFTATSQRSGALGDLALTASMSASGNAGGVDAREGAAGDLALTASLAMAGRHGGSVALDATFPATLELAGAKGWGAPAGDLALSASFGMSAQEGASRDLGVLAVAATMAAAGVKGGIGAGGELAVPGAVMAAGGSKATGGGADLALAASWTLQARKGALADLGVMVLVATLTANAAPSTMTMLLEAILAMTGAKGGQGAAGDIHLTPTMAANLFLAGADASLSGDEYGATITEG